MDKIIKELSNNANIKIINLNFGEIECKLIFHIFLSDIKLYNMYFRDKITRDNIYDLDKVYPGVYYKGNFITNEFLSSLFNGNIILITKENEKYIPYLIICPQPIGRSISDSIHEPANLVGARDGFVESIEINQSLIQRRIKSDSLYTERLIIGKRGNTVINVIYIKDIVKKTYVNEVINKITAMNIDVINSIKDIALKFEKNSLFPVTAEIGSPEIAVEDLLEGRIIILVDQIPIALALPVDISYFMTLKEGKHNKPLVTIYGRILSIICLLFSCYFLGLYAALINYHTDNLSLIAISEIKSSLRGSTLPLYLEFLFLILIFDILRLSSTKSPNATLQNVIVTVGGLLIGQNAVNSGFISAFNLVISAIAYISSFAITNNQRFVNAISIIRLIVLLSGMFLGILGVISSIIVITVHINKQKSLQTLYLSPLIPMNKTSLFSHLFGSNIFKKIMRQKQNDIVDYDRGNLWKNYLL